MIKPSLKKDNYSKFEIDSYSLKFADKRIESSFDRKKIKSDAKFHKYFLLLLFLSLVSLQYFHDGGKNEASSIALSLFTMFLFFCWICSLFRFYQKNFIMFNQIVNYNDFLIKLIFFLDI